MPVWLSGAFVLGLVAGLWGQVKSLLLSGVGKFGRYQAELVS